MGRGLVVMALLTRDELRDRLLRCIEDATDLAQGVVAEPLPRFYRFELHGFGRAGMESWLDEIMAHLYRDGTFPRVVDVAVVGVFDGATIIWIRPSGHAFESEVDTTFFQPAHTAPFKPAVFGRGSPPRSLHDLEEASPAWSQESGDQSGMLRQTLDEISTDMRTSRLSSLRRFWIIFERTEERYDCDMSLPCPGEAAKIGIADAFSCGVTGSDIEDALNLVQSVIFGGRLNPPVLAIIHDVDLPLLGRNIRINALRTQERGIWYPPLEEATH